jgi:seryl-tRNA synthetase
MENRWVELDWPGQRLYLPEYTKQYRKIEAIFSNYLLQSGFEECLFPKLITESQNQELRTEIPRLANEWSKEQIKTKQSGSDTGRQNVYSLPHWQCEPFYYYLQKFRPEGEVKFFDKSGWSYRFEDTIDDYRLFEFQRIESVWACDSEIAILILDSLLHGLSNIISDLGLCNSIIERHEEEKKTSECFVRDIVVSTKEFDEIEVVGGHVHGHIFMDGLKINLPEYYYTGCCGIGISRIANAICEKLL